MLVLFERAEEILPLWERAAASLAKARARPSEKRRAVAALDLWLALRAVAGDNVTQRTGPWYARRGKAVGGSQLGKLSGKSKWGGPWQVVVDIAKSRGWGGGRYTGWMAAAAWGTLLEPLSDMLVQALGGELRSSGSLWGPVAGHSNSPDGVAWIKLERFRRYIKTTTDPEGATTAGAPRDASGLALLEYKSYYSRKLAPEAPCEEHAQQVYGGLDAVPLARRGLLINTVTRRCPLRQWKSKAGYNPQPIGAAAKEDYPGQAVAPEALAAVVFHFGPAGGRGLEGSPAKWPRDPAGGAAGYPPLRDDDGRSPMARDLFDFAGGRELSEADLYTASRLRLVWLRAETGGEVLDLGEAEPAVVNEIMWMESRGLLWAEFALVVSGGERVARSRRKAALRGAGIGRPSAVAVLPAKMLEIEAHVFERARESTTAKLRPRIWAALECAGDLVAGEEVEEVKAKFARRLAAADAPEPSSH